MKKLMTIGMLIMIGILSTTFTGCKKDGETGPKGETGATGPTGPAGTNGINGSNGFNGAPGPDATSYLYNLTFTTAQNYQSYYGITPAFDAGDQIITYVKNSNLAGEDFYVALPYVFAGAVNIYAEVGHTSGSIFIHTDRANGTTGSPWTSTTTLSFKSVLIKGHAMEEHPNLNLNDYEAVMTTFNLR
jgi:hypothetical protein